VDALKNELRLSSRRSAAGAVQLRNSHVQQRRRRGGGGGGGGVVNA